MSWCAAVAKRDEHIERTERLARAVGGLRRAMVSRASRALARTDDNLVHWRLISAIAFDGLHSQLELAERTDVDPAGTSRALDELEALGLVARLRDEDDRRRVNVSLTAKGKRWYERVRVQVFSELAPLFDGLSQRDGKQLEALLARVLERR
jgi:DNA-binding MarR family transcriptional regulator